ncbi:hypothetical protein [Lysobacter olei]
MKRLTITIERAAGLVIPATCFDFELPVLEAIHGDEAITVESDEDVDDLAAGDAYNLLTSRYGREPVKSVYRDTAALARVTGLTGAGEGGKDAQASIKVREPAKKAATKK